MSIKILTTADLHIGRTSSGGETLGDSASTRAAWARMVDYATNNKIDVVAIAGDVVEHANRYFEAASALEAGLTQLDEAGIFVFIVSGNHDYDVLPKLMARNTFDKVHLLGQGGKWEFKSVEISAQKIQFAGWSFPSMHVKNDPLLDFPASEVDPDALCIGLIHGDYNMKESTYAPLQLSTLSDNNVDAWVMGHIHKSDVFKERDPLIFYPGSPQALSAKEKGEHGAVLISVNGQGLIEREVVPLSSIRYEDVVIDISDCSQDEIQAKVIDECDANVETNVDRYDHLELVSLDIILTGTHGNLAELDDWIRNWSFKDADRELAGLRVSVRKVVHQCRVKVENLEELSNEPSPAGLLARTILELENGETSPFAESLKKEAWSAIGNLNAHTTYLPLRGSEKAEQLEKGDVNDLVLQECQRLLSELMQTKKAEG